MTRAGELDVTDRCGRGGFETVDEASCLVDRDHGVPAAVDDQERRRVAVHPGDRGRLPEDLRMTADLAADDNAFQEVDEPIPFDCAFPPLPLPPR